MKRQFVHAATVTDALREQKIPDAALRLVEIAIMRGDGATIAGTGGLKKIRCGSAGKGKSGSVRIIFADYPKAGRTYLLAAFAKNEKANVTARERNDLRILKLMLDQAMEKMVQHETKS